MIKLTAASNQRYAFDELYEEEFKIVGVEGAYLKTCDLNQDGEVDENDYNICRDIVL